MKHFKNGHIGQWQRVKAGDVIKFESNKAKRVEFQVNANSKVEVWAATQEGMKDAVLQGVADDKLAVEYTALGTSYVQIKAEKDAAVFVNIPDVDQQIQSTGKDSFVSIEPRVRNNDEFAKMMHWVKLNEQRRDAQLAEERKQLAALKAQLSKQNLETQPLAVPEAQSHPGAQPDATGEAAAK
jgi:uncharacterized protein YgiM (DUF1202 family)